MCLTATHEETTIKLTNTVLQNKCLVKVSLPFDL